LAPLRLHLNTLTCMVPCLQRLLAQVRVTALVPVEGLRIFIKPVASACGRWCRGFRRLAMAGRVVRASHCLFHRWPHALSASDGLVRAAGLFEATCGPQLSDSRTRGLSGLLHGFRGGVGRRFRWRPFYGFRPQTGFIRVSLDSLCQWPADCSYPTPRAVGRRPRLGICFVAATSRESESVGLSS